MRDAERGRSAIASDAADIWHRRIKWVLTPLLAVYFFKTVVTPSETRVKEGEVLSVGRDSGLLMTLQSPFPPWLLALHSMAALLLFMAMIVQKEVVRMMSCTAGSDSGGWQRAHRRVGYFGLLLVLLMDLAGFICAVGPYSSFAGFQTFAYFFAAPFALFLIGVCCTASPKRIELHAFMGNALLKGSVATPFSRIGGAVLQRSGWAPAAGYYQGIFAVVCVFGLWQLADIYTLCAKMGWLGLECSSDKNRGPHKSKCS